jgi:type I restriction enzyme M protein
MVDEIDPQLGETVLVPLVLLEGFLTCTIDHGQSKQVKQQPRDVLQNPFWDREKPLPHLLCTTNLMLHGFDFLPRYVEIIY